MERTIPNCKKRRTGLDDQRVRRSRDDLRDALLDLLQKRDFESITVREISSQADVGYTTFFRHFSSKEALLDAVVSVEIQRLTDRSLPVYDSTDARGACLALCTYVDEHRALWSALLTGGAAPKVREEMLKQSRRAAPTRATARSLPAELAAALSVAVILELLSWWLRQPAPWPASRVAEVLYDRVIAPA
ncbi:MAG: helix-turn-helix domain-containing protein [Solimonas sp.]